MKRSPVFVLVDCNNFFASCERVFRPDLRDKPVAVLSNNDGCVIARSNEVKRLGVPMGAPYFKYRDLLTRGQVSIFSANFQLYGDMSQRVTEVLKEFSPHIEIYSVDESFLQIDDLPITDYTAWAREVSARVERATGVPVSVGVAPTKTLAKLAAERAKKDLDRYRGGYSLAPDQHLKGSQLTEEVTGALKWWPVGDVWGVGWRGAPKLKQVGISTAYDLTQVSDEWALKHLTIRGLRMVKELRGESCIPLEDKEEPQKSIAATRSFGHTVRAIHELEAAVATFSARAAAKARRQRELVWSVTTYIRTSKHAERPYGVATTTRLSIPSSDTADIIRAALENLYAIYDPEFAYSKAGVILTELVSERDQQLSLLEARPPEMFSKRVSVMAAMDELNRRFGSGTITHAIQEVGHRERWQSKRQRSSPAYTTNWAQLPVVRV